MIDAIRNELQKWANSSYKEFHQKLVPGLTTMMGVRMPRLREIAKTAAKGDWKEIWDQLREECYEELMIKGMLIGYGKLSRREQTEYLKVFIPQINNWAICDCCCSTWKFMKKDQAYWFDFLYPYLFSNQEYQIRFGLVSLLAHFIGEEYLHLIFSLLVSDSPRRVLCKNGGSMAGIRLLYPLSFRNVDVSGTGSAGYVYP